MLSIKTVVFLSGLTLMGCASSTSKPDSKSNALTHKFVELEYYDSEVFDYNLASTLKNRTKQVKLTLLSPININSIPQRLDKWLASIKKYEGKIELAIDPDAPVSKGLITEAIDLLVMSYRSIKETTLYSAAQDYDIKLFYIKGEGTITTLLFTHKPRNPEPDPVPRHSFEPEMVQIPGLNANDNIYTLKVHKDNLLHVQDVLRQSIKILEKKYSEKLLDRILRVYFMHDKFIPHHSIFEILMPFYQKNQDIFNKLLEKNFTPKEKALILEYLKRATQERNG